MIGAVAAATLTPAALGAVAGMLLLGIPAAAIFGAIYAAVPALIVIGFIGVPLHWLYRRLKLTSLESYVLTGVGTGLALAGWGAWQTNFAGYYSEQQALQENLTVLAILISAPLSAADFWRALHPDLFSRSLTGRDASRLGGAHASKRTALFPGFPFYAGTLVLVVPALAITIAASAARQDMVTLRPVRELMLEGVSLDPPQASRLVLALDGFATRHNAHLTYAFWTWQMSDDAPPRTEFQAHLRYPDGIKISLHAIPTRRMSASAYAPDSTPDDVVETRWTVLSSGVAGMVQASGEGAAGAADVSQAHGEGGVLPPRRWWDLRVRRRTIGAA